MSTHYILDNQKVVGCKDLITWARWLEGADRAVAKDTIGESDISTVFLGLDHSFGKGPPLLFETMVFGGKLSDEMNRYSTWDEAVLGHKAMCERVKSEI
jgi:hypothetical protein